MASIQPTNVTTANAATSQQLNGIVTTTPMPTAGVLADGSPFTLALNDHLSIGGQTRPDYTISAGGDAAALAAAGAGQITVGGGATAPAAGAQPAAPTTAAAAATKVEGGGALAPGESNAVPVTGFGRNERDSKMLASVDGAEFSFPAFNESKKRNSAPDISWGPGWTKVQKGDMFYMEHANGTKAIPALEYRTNNSPAGKTQTVKVANGWGKKYPDGTILVFDRNEGPYRLDAKGEKHKLSLGTHTFGGVKVRVFEASVVRTLEPNGEVRVFDSRGNAKAGTTRKTIANGLGNADAGASTSGGGKTPVDGGGAPGKPGMLVGGGGLTKEQLTADVQKMTEIARGILAEIRSGNVDPARLEALQAQLATLPSGILQAAGAAGTMSTDGILAARHADHEHDATTTTTTETAPPPGATVGNATGGGDATTPPTAGVDANASTKHVKAGEQLKLDITIPSELVGKQARFAQLPTELQEALAAALGSNQGAAAMTADRLVAFGKDGTATIVESGDVFIRRAKKVYGAGPGEDIAATMKPGRQPGGSHTKVASSTAASSTSGGGASGVTVASNGADSVSYPGAINTTKRHQVFGPGGRVQHVDLGGVSGTFTWKTLPQAAKNAIRDFLANEPTEASSQAYAARPGTGWKFDENAVVTVEAGFATFPDGMSLTRDPKPEAAPVDVVSGGGSGSGATSQPVGHDATRPPAGGGGTSPATPPPTPNIGAGSGGSVHDHH